MSHTNLAKMLILQPSCLFIVYSLYACQSKVGCFCVGCVKSEKNHFMVKSTKGFWQTCSHTKKKRWIKRLQVLTEEAGETTIKTTLGWRSADGKWQLQQPHEPWLWEECRASRLRAAGASEYLNGQDVAIGLLCSRNTSACWPWDDFSEPEVWLWEITWQCTSHDTSHHITHRGYWVAEDFQAAGKHEQRICLRKECFEHPYYKVSL